MTQQDKLSRARNMVDFRLKAIKRKAQAVGKFLSERDLDIAKTKLELKVCNELELDFFDYCKNYTKK